MARKCYISFKTEDIAYKNHILDACALDVIDKSLNEPIQSNDEDYILRKIREDYLSDSTVTIHLIGLYGAENRGWEEQRFIKRELQASLYSGDGNPKKGILGVVLPDRQADVYKGASSCSLCNRTHNLVNINDSTTISEFSYNYYIPNNKCAHAVDDRYCVLVKWDDFLADPAQFLDQAFDKRSAPIAEKTKVRP